ncbi:MAG: hypothetical protein RL491_1225 [Bacteroidota bacterium]
MKSAIVHIAFLLTLVGTLNSFGQNANDFSSRLAYQVALIQESKTADDIYIIKSRIDKLSQEARTYSEKKQIIDASLLMSDKFASYSHFKSGALVYLNYLELNEQLHKIEVQMVKDSIQSFRSVSPSETASVTDESLSDRSEVNADQTVSNSDASNSSNSLEGNSSSESSSGSNLKWVIGLTIVVVLMLFVFWGQRKKIASVKTLLEQEQSDLKRLFRISANVSMLSGAIRYAREFSSHCAVVLSDLIEITNQNKRDSKVDSSKASQAVSVFKRISNGENKSL